MTVYLTDIATRFDERLAELFREKGFDVASGDDLDSLDTPVDIFIATGNERCKDDHFTVTDGISPDVIMDAVHRNVSLPIKRLEKAIPLMERGEMKRICFLSGHSASVNMSGEISGYGYNMSKAALHNALTIIRNRLRRDGYTFRLFDPLLDESAAESAANTAVDYFISSLGYDLNNFEKGQNEEKRLTLRDALGREWPW